jgi:predicted dehydrogenase
LLEARHYQFHPAWHAFLALFDPKDVESADATTALPGGLFSPDDIRFRYDLAGGTLMDLGTYNLSALRGIFGADPVSVTSATPRLMAPPYDSKCESAMLATYQFPNGSTATLSCDLDARVKKSSGTWWSWLFDSWPNYTATGMPPICSVVLRPKHGVEEDMKITTQKTITLNNFMGPHIWHRIDIQTTTTYRDANDLVVRTEKSTESKKQYTWPEGTGRGEDWWPTYRYMVEAFVDRVKGRESKAWVDGEDSVRQMESIDKTYERAGMAIRPTSESLRSASRA